MRTRFLFLFFFAALAGAAFGDDTMVRVKADRVNLRGRPDANGEVVGQLSAGDEIKVVQTGDLWIGITPPEKIKSWIHKDFLQDGKVTVKELTVRAGPSINYPRIGSLTRGDVVTPRETFGDWICVAPPTNAVVWVHRELLDLSGGEISKSMATATPTVVVIATVTSAETRITNRIPLESLPPEVSPEAVIVTNSAVEKIRPSVPGQSVVRGAPSHDAVMMPPSFAPGSTNAAVPASVLVADLKLVPLPGQGSVVQHEGFVKPSPYLLAPGHYRLALKKGGNLETVCFLRGNSQQLATLVDQYFSIGGREYWVQSVREPVLVIERIERRPAPEEKP